jgi:hypothetical protein
MNARFLAATFAAAATLALSACKPPPSDAVAARAMLSPSAAGPSQPLASPDTTGAIWAQSKRPMRLVYGVPGQPVLVSLECLDPATPAARLRIARHAPADQGAGALLALIGNRMVARIAVDATEQGGGLIWQGEAAAALPSWDALADPVDATITVPGAGLVRLNPSPLPVELVTACRGPQQPAPPANPE